MIGRRTLSRERRTISHRQSVSDSGSRASRAPADPRRRIAARVGGRPPVSYIADAPLRGGFGTPSLVRPRLGQRSFRIAVLDSYDRKCAVTNERTLPVLEAAHIRDYRDVQEHTISNGILFRADIHKLFDTGYVTVTPDHHFEVSPPDQGRVRKTGATTTSSTARRFACPRIPRIVRSPTRCCGTTRRGTSDKSSSEVNAERPMMLLPCILGSPGAAMSDEIRDITTVTFSGPRFEDAGLELDVLPELVAYRKLLVETRKSCGAPRIATGNGGRKASKNRFV